MTAASSSAASATSSAAQAHETIAGTRQDLTDGGCEAHHDPNLYAYQKIAKAFGDGTLSSAASSSTDITEPKGALEEQYHRDGLLVFPQAFTDKVPHLLDTSIGKFATGQNKIFSARVAELVQSGTTPDFSSGEKIPWVQYEARTEVSHTVVVSRNRDQHQQQEGLTVQYL
jgi:hypothetical protein